MKQQIDAFTVYHRFTENAPFLSQKNIPIPLGKRPHLLFPFWGHHTIQARQIYIASGFSPGNFLPDVSAIGYIYIYIIYPIYINTHKWFQSYYMGYHETKTLKNVMMEICRDISRWSKDLDHCQRSNDHCLHPYWLWPLPLAHAHQDDNYPKIQWPLPRPTGKLQVGLAGPVPGIHEWRRRRWRRWRPWRRGRWHHLMPGRWELQSLVKSHFMYFIWSFIWVQL